MTLASQLRDRKVYNSSNLVSEYAHATGNVGVYISYSHNDGSRMSTGTLDGYHVVRPGFKTDPDGHWTDNGHKAFHASWSRENGDGYDTARSAAIEWTNNRYHTTEWTRIPGFFKDWFPVEVLAWAKEYVKS